MSHAIQYPIRPSLKRKATLSNRLSHAVTYVRRNRTKAKFERITRELASIPPQDRTYNDRFPFSSPVPRKHFPESEISDWVKISGTQPTLKSATAIQYSSFGKLIKPKELSRRYAPSNFTPHPAVDQFVDTKQLLAYWYNRAVKIDASILPEDPRYAQKHGFEVVDYPKDGSMFSKAGSSAFEMLERPRMPQEKETRGPRKFIQCTTSPSIYSDFEKTKIVADMQSPPLQRKRITRTVQSSPNDSPAEYIPPPRFTKRKQPLAKETKPLSRLHVPKYRHTIDVPPTQKQKERPRPVRQTTMPVDPLKELAAKLRAEREICRAEYARSLMSSR